MNKVNEEGASQLLGLRGGFERRSDVWRAFWRAKPRGGGQAEEAEADKSCGQIPPLPFYLVQGKSYPMYEVNTDLYVERKGAPNG